MKRTLKLIGGFILAYLFTLWFWGCATSVPRQETIVRGEIIELRVGRNRDGEQVYLIRVGYRWGPDSTYEQRPFLLYRNELVVLGLSGMPVEACVDVSGKFHKLARCP